MNAKTRTRSAALTAVGGAALMAIAGALPAQAAQATPGSHTGQQDLQVAVFAAGGVHTGPDDLTTLDGHVFVAYQNGVGSQGEASASGATRSTVVEYTRRGKQLASWQLTGKVDGMTADRGRHRIVATVNEDGNSSLYTIALDEDHSRVTHYAYASNPLPHGGGTDSIAVVGGQLIVTASAPAADANGTTYSRPALYRVTLSGSTASTTPIFADNAAATDAVTGKQTTLNLSDPDSSLVMPRVSPRFAGDLLLDSQGDSQLVFLAHPDTARQSATVLNLPTQVDDTAVVTSRRGTLLVTDAGSNQVKAVTGPFTVGEVIVAIPSDSTTQPGTLATLDLNTGAMTTLSTAFVNPKGLRFVPAHD